MSDNVNPRKIPNLKDYDVSEEVGFLLDEPLVELPEYFEAWSKLAKNLSDLLKKKELRNEVHEMPFLENYMHELTEDVCPGLKRKRLCLAFVYLTFIGSAYIWEDENNIPKVIPRQLAIPWYYISKELGMKPATCIASLALYNYKKPRQDEQLSLENVELICEFPESRWLFQVAITAEVNAVKGIKAILKAMEAVRDGNNEALCSALGDIKASLEQMKATSRRLYEHMTGDAFFNVVRIYLSGYGGRSTKIPNGMKFEGVPKETEGAINSNTGNDDDRWITVTATDGNAAQSSTIQSFDAALGIDHQSENVKDTTRKFLTDIREYMPPKHKAFIEAVAKGPSIKEYVANSGDQKVRDAYESAVKALRSFRDVHMGLIAHYVLKPASKKKESESTAKDEEKGPGEKGLQDLQDFLTSLRDSTQPQAYL